MGSVNDMASSLKRRLESQDVEGLSLGSSSLATPVDGDGGDGGGRRASGEGKRGKGKRPRLDPAEQEKKTLQDMAAKVLAATRDEINILGLGFSCKITERGGGSTRDVSFFDESGNRYRRKQDILKSFGVLVDLSVDRNVCHKEALPNGSTESTRYETAETLPLSLNDEACKEFNVRVTDIGTTVLEYMHFHAHDAIYPNGYTATCHFDAVGGEVHDLAKYSSVVSDSSRNGPAFRVLMHIPDSFADPIEVGRGATANEAWGVVFTAIINRDDGQKAYILKEGGKESILGSLGDLLFGLQNPIVRKYMEERLNGVLECKNYVYTAQCVGGTQQLQKEWKSRMKVVTKILETGRKEALRKIEKFQAAKEKEKKVRAAREKKLAEKERAKKQREEERANEKMRRYKEKQLEKRKEREKKKAEEAKKRKEKEEIAEEKRIAREMKEAEKLAREAAKLEKKRQKDAKNAVIKLGSKQVSNRSFSPTSTPPSKGAVDARLIPRENFQSASLNVKGRNVNSKLEGYERQHFLKQLKEQQKRVNDSRRNAQQHALSLERQRYEDSLKMQDEACKLEKQRLIRVRADLKTSGRVADTYHREECKTIRDTIKEAFMSKMRQAGEEVSPQTCGAQSESSTSVVIPRKAENSNFKGAFHTESTYAFNVDEQSRGTQQMEQMEYVLPRTCINKLTGGIDSNHFLSSWHFLTLFGDILGVFPRQKQVEEREESSDSSEDEDEEETNLQITEEDVNTRRSGRLSSNSMAAKIKDPSPKSDGKMEDSDDDNTDSDMEGDLLEDTNDVQQEDGTSGASSSDEDDAGPVEAEEKIFKSLQEVQDALDYDSGYEDEADAMQDPKDDVHEKEGFLSKKARFSERVHLLDLCALLINPSGASNADRVWLDVVHTRMLRALLQYLCDDTEERFTYEDASLQMKFQVLRRSCNILTWPEIFRQYLYLVANSIKFESKENQKFFSWGQDVKHAFDVAPGKRHPCHLLARSNSSDASTSADSLTIQSLIRNLTGGEDFEANGPALEVDVEEEEADLSAIGCAQFLSTHGNSLGWCYRDREQSLHGIKDGDVDFTRRNCSAWAKDMLKVFPKNLQKVEHSTTQLKNAISRAIGALTDRRSSFRGIITVEHLRRALSVLDKGDKKTIEICRRIAADAVYEECATDSFIHEVELRLSEDERATSLDLPCASAVAYHKDRVNRLNLVSKKCYATLMKLFLRCRDKTIHIGEFLKPVTLRDYRKYVQKPIDLRVIYDKVMVQAYLDENSFRNDVHQVWANCRAYCNDRFPMVVEDMQRIAEIFEREFLSVFEGRGSPWEDWMGFPPWYGQHVDQKGDVIVDQSLCYTCACPPSSNNKIIICEVCKGDFHLHCVEPALDRVPDGDYICPYCDDKLQYKQLACGSPMEKTHRGGAGTSGRAKRYLHKQISRSMAGYAEPFVGDIVSWSKQSGYKVEYLDGAGSECMTWEELSVVLKEMENEMGEKFIADIDKESDPADTKDESVVDANVATLDGFAHVGLPVMLENETIGIVEGLKSGSVSLMTVGGAVSLTKGAFENLLSVIDGEASPFAQNGPPLKNFSAEHSAAGDLKSEEQVLSGTLVWARLKKNAPYWPAELIKQPKGKSKPKHQKVFFYGDDKWAVVKNNTSYVKQFHGNAQIDEILMTHNYRVNSLSYLILQKGVEVFRKRAEQLAAGVAGEETLNGSMQNDDEEEDDDGGSDGESDVNDDGTDNGENIGSCDSFGSGGAGTKQWCYETASRLARRDYDHLEASERFQILHFLCDSTSSLREFRDLMNDRLAEYRQLKRELENRETYRDRKIFSAFFKKKQDLVKAEKEAREAARAAATFNGDGLSVDALNDSKGSGDIKPEETAPVGAGIEEVVEESTEIIPSVTFHEVTERWYASYQVGSREHVVGLFESETLAQKRLDERLSLCSRKALAAAAAVSFGPAIVTPLGETNRSALFLGNHTAGNSDSLDPELRYPRSTLRSIVVPLTALMVLHAEELYQTYLKTSGGEDNFTFMLNEWKNNGEMEEKIYRVIGSFSLRKGYDVLYSLSAIGIVETVREDDGKVHKHIPMFRWKGLKRLMDIVSHLKDGTASLIGLDASGSGVFSQVSVEGISGQLFRYFMTMLEQGEMSCAWKDCVNCVRDEEDPSKAKENASRRINDIMNVWKALGLIKYINNKARWADGVSINSGAFSDDAVEIAHSSLKAYADDIRSKSSVAPVSTPRNELKETALRSPSSAVNVLSPNDSASGVPTTSPLDGERGVAVASSDPLYGQTVKIGTVGLTEVTKYFIKVYKGPPESGNQLPQKISLQSDLWPRLDELRVSDFKHRDACTLLNIDYEKAREEERILNEKIRAKEPSVHSNWTPMSGEFPPRRDQVTCGRCAQVYFDVCSDLIECNSCDTYIWCGRDDIIGKIQKLPVALSKDSAACACNLCGGAFHVPLEVLNKVITSTGKHLVEVSVKPSIYRPWGPGAETCGGVFRCERCKSVHAVVSGFVEATTATMKTSITSDTESEEEEENEASTKDRGASFTVKTTLRRVVPSLTYMHEKAEEKLGEVTLPMSAGAVTFDSFGDLPDDLTKLQAYHSETYLFPIGFSSHREYYNATRPDERCMYNSRIEDGGMDGPVFVVLKEDDGTRWQSMSSSGAWKAVLETLTKTKATTTDEGSAGSNTGTAISGPDMFGLSKSTAVYLMQGLPRSDLCRSYQYRGAQTAFALQYLDDNDENSTVGTENILRLAGKKKNRGRGLNRTIRRLNRRKGELAAVRKFLQQAMMAHEEKLLRLDMKRRLLKCEYERKYEAREARDAAREAAREAAKEAKNSRDEGKEKRLELMNECIDTFDLKTFFLSSQMVQKDTGVMSKLGMDRGENVYYVLGGPWARLFVENHRSKDVYLVNEVSELESILNFLNPLGLSEGPLLKELTRIKPLLLRTLVSFEKDAHAVEEKPNFDKVIHNLNEPDLLILAVPALKSLPRRWTSPGSFLSGPDDLVLKAHREGKQGSDAFGNYKHFKKVEKMRHYAPCSFRLKIIKYSLLSLYDNIPKDAILPQLSNYSSKWQKTVLSATIARQLMGALLILESSIREDAVEDWYKEYYAYDFTPSKKKKDTVAPMKKPLKLDAVATVMADATDALVMSRLLAFDEGINFKFRVKRAYKRRGSSIGAHTQKKMKKPSKSVAKVSM